MKRIFYLLGFSLFVLSCEQPEIGYISDNIHSPVQVIDVSRGVFYAPKNYPVVEGTTYPIEWSLAGITDKNGLPTTELTDLHEIRIWTKAFDPRTDTTLEIAEQKLKLSNEPSMVLNAVSGDFIFTQSSKYVQGDEFTVSMKAKNIRGERTIDNYTKIRMKPFQPITIENEMRSRLQINQIGTATWDSPNGFNYSIMSATDPLAKGVLDGTDPYITAVKISNEPKLAVKVKMIIQDSYGVSIDPKKVTEFMNGTDRLQNYHDNTIGVVTDSESSTFGLPAPPFPQYGKTYASGANMYLMYYNTTTDAFLFDKVAYEKVYGVKNWAKYIDPATGQFRARAYIRWAVKIHDTGTWQLKMKIPYTIAK